MFVFLFKNVFLLEQNLEEMTMVGKWSSSRIEGMVPDCNLQRFGFPLLHLLGPNTWLTSMFHDQIK